jgi:hypothetical protein
VEAGMSYVLKSYNERNKTAGKNSNEVNESASTEPNATDAQNNLDNDHKKEDAFRESDIQLARVLEDLISLLIDRDFIRFTDFPEPAQKRLIEREGLRMKNAKLNLLDDENH